MNIPYHVSENLETIFGFNSLLRMRIRIRYPIIFLTLDPGWKKFGSWINSPNPKHSQSHFWTSMHQPSSWLIAFFILFIKTDLSVSYSCKIVVSLYFSRLLCLLPPPPAIVMSSLPDFWLCIYAPSRPWPIPLYHPHSRILPVPLLSINSLGGLSYWPSLRSLTIKLPRTPGKSQGNPQGAWKTNWPEDISVVKKNIIFLFLVAVDEELFSVSESFPASD